jgi:type 1 glutamine amidotransferase
LAAFAASPLLPAQVGIENRRFMEGKKHILFLGGSKYYAHDAVSKAAFTMAKLGVTKQKFKQYRNAKNLNYFDAVFLYTQGEFPITDDQKTDLLSFVRDDGKGVLVAHSGMDFNRWEYSDDDTMHIKDDGGWPELIDMLGGIFISHPWRQKVRVNVEDQTFPATKHLPKTLEIEDEIYQLGPQYSRDKVRVLVSLDVSTVDLKNPPLAKVARTDLDFPVVWVKTYGKGRVFVSPLGHIMGHWDREDMQKMWLEAARWVLRLNDGDATPRPRPGTQ